MIFLDEVLETYNFKYIQLSLSEQVKKKSVRKYIRLEK